MKKVVVVGAGPAGLMAAQTLSAAGLAVLVYDAMPSAARKFLLAGKGGLNLTHSEPAERFVQRYGARQAQLAPMLAQFGASQVRAWAEGLGVSTFVGSSGRVFPSDMKAAPLLRSWLHRLRHAEPAVQFRMRQRWVGWSEPGTAGPLALRFESAGETHTVSADAVVLALGGGSWARLGSDGAWVPWLRARGVDVAPLLPSNCGFDVRAGWSAHFASRFVGQAFKSVAISVDSPASARQFHQKGEFVATASGVEGSLIYAASSLLRDDILATGQASFWLDLLPDWSPARVLAEVRHPRGTRSLTTHLKSRLPLDGIKIALLYELLTKDQMNDAQQLATAIKALPVVLQAARPLDEAISSAGGVRFEALHDDLMLRAVPGVFCAGEMLDWEAPTGGYLLTACMASGVRAAQGVLAFLGASPVNTVNTPV